MSKGGKKGRRQNHQPAIVNKKPVLADEKTRSLSPDLAPSSAAEHRSNRIAIISLMIALLTGLTGGLPGFYSLYEKYHEFPAFSFHNNITITVDAANLYPKHKGSPMVLISGIIANTGTKPLSPAIFRYAAKIKGRWMEFRTLPIPPVPSISVASPNGPLVYESPSYLDLCRFTGSLDPDQARSGHVLCSTDEITHEELTKLWPMPMKLICVDVMGRKYES